MKSYGQYVTDVTFSTDVELKLIDVGNDSLSSKEGAGVFRQFFCSEMLEFEGCCAVSWKKPLILVQEKTMPMKAGLPLVQRDCKQADCIPCRRPWMHQCRTSGRRVLCSACWQVHSLLWDLAGSSHAAMEAFRPWRAFPLWYMNGAMCSADSVSTDSLSHLQ